MFALSRTITTRARYRFPMVTEGKEGQNKKRENIIDMEKLLLTYFFFLYLKNFLH